jgi:hypothetical protein
LALLCAALSAPPQPLKGGSPVKKMLVVLGVLVLMSSALTSAQNPITEDGPYKVTYFSNNSGPVAGAPDQDIELVNTGALGNGLPNNDTIGNICSSIYVFDNNQEMIACCACRTTPNGLASASVGTQLTNNPVTSVVPVAGVIKILNTAATTICDPTTVTTQTLVPGIVGFSSHLKVTGGATFLTETAIPNATLSAGEFFFLQTACSFVRYLGSGKGTCSCTVPGLGL